MRCEERQRRRFSEVVAQGIADPRLRALMSMRSDFLGELQKDEPLYNVHRQINVPPLREAELREVVSRPAELLSARFETAGLADIITRRTAEDSAKDVGALPLLSYTLDDMWTQMVKRGDGVLRLPAQSFELGGVLVDRANAFLATHPKSQDELRRIFTLKLATVREGEEPTRRRAPRSEFTDEEWRLVSELSDHPNRLLVTATPEGGETYAEVAHEAIFRRWDKLREWMAAERDFLVWKTGLEGARRSWEQAAERTRNDALLMGLALAQAQSWLGKRSDDIPEIDRYFTVLSRKVARRRKWSRRALIRMLVWLGASALFSLVQSTTEMGFVRSSHERNVSLMLYQTKKVVRAIEADETKAEGKPGKATATALGEISWYQLYAGRPDEALEAAERALSIVPGMLRIEASRAHALMFLDRREEALAVYLSHKNKSIAANDNESWQKAIAEDFEVFREMGHSRPLMAEIEKMLGVTREK